MLILRGEPSILLTKVEKPLFFRNMALLGSRPSSEYLLERAMPLLDLGGAASGGHSPDEKLADCLKPVVVVCGGGDVYESGGGGGRRSEICRPGDLVTSSVLLPWAWETFSSMDCIMAVIPERYVGVP